MKKINTPHSIVLSDTSINIPGYVWHTTLPQDDNFHGMLPYDNASISEIIVRESAEPFTGTVVQKTFRECRRILKPGGTVYLGINARPGIEQQNRLNELAEHAVFCGLTPFSLTVSAPPPPAKKFAKGLCMPELVLEFKKPPPETNETQLVSLLIPAFRSDFIGSCIESCLRQTYSTIEIIVLDDSPDTRIGEITREYQNKDPRISYIRNTPALGEAENLMKGIRLASGKLIKPVCDDDELMDDAVERLTLALENAPGTTLAAGPRLPIDACGDALSPGILDQPLNENSGRYDGRMTLEKMLATRRNILGEPTAMMFRKSDALAVKENHLMNLHGYPCVGLGDVCTAMHLLSKGDLAYVASPVCKFRIHGGQTQRQDGTQKEFINTWDFLRRKAKEFGLIPALDKPTDSESEQSYQKWLRQRVLSDSDIKHLTESLAELDEAGRRFQIFVRVPVGHEALLAETLDSLEGQYLGTWRLDILTEIPAPDGLEDIPCIAWHTAEEAQHKAIINHLAEELALDWCLEIPAGARLDPLYLWRISKESAKIPAARCFFVDDDSVDTSGKRHSPRFKPGANPRALESADLAGPICVSRECWHATGGASATGNSPWFSQLLRIARHFGWASIKHTPDVLITYPEYFPTDGNACTTALAKYLADKNTDAEILRLTPNSWSYRCILRTPPLITVAIIASGNRDFLYRCAEGILSNTDYPSYELIVVHSANDLPASLEILGHAVPCHVTEATNVSHASRCNLAVTKASGEFVLLIDEAAQVIQDSWLTELVRTGLHDGIAGIAPRLVQPGTTLIESIGPVLGLEGIVDSPYRGLAKLGDSSYLDSVDTPRDLSALPMACHLVSKAAYLAVGGMNETTFGAYLGELDLSLRLTEAGYRLIYQPLSNVVFQAKVRPDYWKSAAEILSEDLARTHAETAFKQKWWPSHAADPYWSNSLSLSTLEPTPEVEFSPHWDKLPSTLPKILAIGVPNAQCDYRISSYLKAAINDGKASGLVYRDGNRQPSIPELARINPDSLIIQNFIHDGAIKFAKAWPTPTARPFTVYVLDDLITGLDKTNPFKQNIPDDAWGRLRYILQFCDRMVVSTTHLAETYQHLIKDIVVVPNRLEQGKWRHLKSQKRTGNKPRIGWAGGTTHQGDLLLLEEIIRRTRDEADWVFFGMCPDEIRLLLKEFHPIVEFESYPAHLASLNFDIAVAPLATTQFNRGKSNLRLLEYGILGIPVVCTDIEPYRDSPACRVPNTPDAWVNALRERIHDAEAREAEGQQLYQWVLDNFILENHADEWLQAHLPH